MARVTFLMGRLPPRTGGEAYDFEIIEDLRQRGYRVDYLWVTPLYKATLAWALPLFGPWLSSALLGLLLAWRRGLFIEDEHFLEPLQLTNPLRRILDRGPLVVVVHHMDRYRSDDPPGLRQWLRRTLAGWRLRQADRVIAVSAHTRREVLSLGVEEARVAVVHPGFQPEGLPSRRAPRQPAGPVRFLCVPGSCSPRKGLGPLLEAVSLLPRGSVEVRIVGDVDTRHYRGVLAPLHQRLGLASAVRFEGRVPRGRLCELYASSDALVHPSLREGFGIVLLEAMHCGLPVVASASDALPELVEDGVNGLLVPPGEAAALARAMSTLAASRELRERMGAAARRRASGRTWARTREEALQVLRPYLEA